MKARIIVIVASILLFSGCFSPSSKNNSAEKKVAEVKEKIERNQQDTIDKARGYVFATDTVLGMETNKSQFNKVGKMFSERAVLTLGNPEMEVANQYKEIINALLSTNEVIKKRGETMLANKDAEVIELQSVIKGLEQKLEKAEEKRKEISAENASLADKWVRLITWIKWAVFSFIALFILRVVASVLPPPYNGALVIFDFIIGGLFKGVSKIFTQATSAAKLVEEKAFVASSNTLKQVVAGIQEARYNRPESELIKKHLDQILGETLDKESKIVIQDVKRDLNHI